jgi:hypothetical protein
MKYDMSDPSSYNLNTLPDSTNENPIRKKAICVGQPPTIVAVIHDSIVKKLHIDEECWFEEIPMKDGIFLKICQK